ncbi:MAG: T9SS type A sorting domain-containing protein, partial [Bacteroidales bacterium]|nr:T9SS type A sorting domain-containing protein [Bacteroidales bacterium]
PTPATLTLDLRTLPAGTYYLRAHTPQGIAIQKLIKR